MRRLTDDTHFAEYRIITVQNISFYSTDGKLVNQDIQLCHESSKMVLIGLINNCNSNQHKVLKVN